MINLAGPIGVEPISNGVKKMTLNIFENIQHSLVTLNIEATLAAINQGITDQVPAYEMLMDGLYEGMKMVGDKFEAGEYFIPELMFAAHIITNAIDILRPHLQTAIKTSGTVIIGTVSGDLHDIGKNIVGTLLTVSGIKVHDLGVDVPVEVWIQKIKEIKPDIVGLSCLMTASISNMRQIIQEMEKQNLREVVQIIVGGGALSEIAAAQIGADAYAYDAMEGLKIIREFID